MKTLLYLILLFPFVLNAQLHPISSVTTSSNTWPKQNAIDNNTSTVWSSNVQSTAGATQYIRIYFSTTKSVNYIKLFPRYINNLAHGFPVSFNIRYYNGSTWTTVRSETNYPRAHHVDYVILPFSGTVSCTAVSIETVTLGMDDVGNYVFQLAEFAAGFDAEFQNSFAYINNNGPYKANGTNEIRNVGSGAFNPNKLNVWHFDIRRPLISGPNIYAPSVVKNGSSNWNIYFGGWDFANSSKDNIYLTTSPDNFLSFTQKALVVSNVPHEHVNNSSVLKLGADNWKMLYTHLPALPFELYPNKPKYATSADGLNWYFNADYLVKVHGYAPWEDVNSDGGNVLFYENGVYHLFFTDYNRPGLQDFRVHHATGTNFIDYTYVGVAKDEPWIATDVKSFTYNSQKYYLMGTHKNDQEIQLSLSQNINSFDSPLFYKSIPHWGAMDINMSTLGFVTDNNRLYGLLYGASSVGGLTDNKIYGSWLQKKVIFQNSYHTWGDVEEAYGPDRVELFMDAVNSIETGRFYIYDSDGTTLLYTSPLVTIRSGDVWNYLLNSGARESSVADNITEEYAATTNTVKLSVYPNPAHDKIVFDCSETINKVEIFDSNGKKMFTREVEENTINIEELEAGIYLIKVYTQAGSLNTKFIKE